MLFREGKEAKETEAGKTRPVVPTKKGDGGTRKSLCQETVKRYLYLITRKQHIDAQLTPAGGNKQGGVRAGRAVGSSARGLACWSAPAGNVSEVFF